MKKKTSLSEVQMTRDRPEESSGTPNQCGGIELDVISQREVFRAGWSMREQQVQSET
jgi:hypothetical protein